MHDELYFHEPCMLRETIELLDPKPGDVSLDCTLGLANHLIAILENTEPSGIGIGIDCDPKAFSIARESLRRYGDRVMLFNRNFTEIPQILREAGQEFIDVAILDAGVSRPQLVDPERGFGFTGTTLDMRMATDSDDITAAELVNTATFEQLRDIFRITQTPPESKSIARAICATRSRKPIETSAELTEIISSALKKRGKSKRNPATAALLALRIHVNHEIENLQAGVEMIARALRPSSGRMVILTYHSLEFRTTRQIIERLERGHDVPPWLPEPPDAHPVIVRLVKKPLKPSAEEPATCRSVRLFAARAL